MDSQKTKEMWEETYARQRKDRLSDIISDFMSDEKVMPSDFYSTLLEDIENSINYYEKEANKYRELKKLLMGQF